MPAPVRLLPPILGLVLTLGSTSAVHADDGIEAMEAYLDFVEYHGATIAPAQIPAADWPRFFIIDAREPARFAAGHIPGAHPIEWRRVLARRDQIPTDRPVLIYCDTGALSAQAGFALRVAGYDNVRILRGGYTAWQAQVAPP
jgi:rhodanese-related sulfurtransferase